MSGAPVPNLNHDNPGNGDSNNGSNGRNDLANDNANNDRAVVVDGEIIAANNDRAVVVDGEIIAPQIIRFDETIGLLLNESYPVGLRVNLSFYQNAWMTDCCLHSHLWFPQFEYKLTLGQVTAVNQLIDRIQHGDRAPPELLRSPNVGQLIAHYKPQLDSLRFATIAVMDLDAQSGIPPCGYHIQDRALATVHRDGPAVNGHLFCYFSALESLLGVRGNCLSIENIDGDFRKLMTAFCQAFTIAVTNGTRSSVQGL